jgi:hypothetical protein
MPRHTVIPGRAKREPGIQTQRDDAGFRVCAQERASRNDDEDETFSRHARYGRMTQPDTWYVAFGPDKAVKTDDSATGLVRSTKTFKSEVDAKLFAMQILAKGWSATAGTLNPHQPKQIVGSAQIERWADPGLGG